MDSTIREIADMLLATGAAHHAAFRSTNGADPEWPLWYADHLVDLLPDVLGSELTRSDIVYELVAAERAHSTKDKGLEWPEFYARRLIDEYAS